MKLVYKIKNKYYKITEIKTMTELEIIEKPREEKESGMFIYNTTTPDTLYYYDEGCKVAKIAIDNDVYEVRNYKWNGNIVLFERTYLWDSEAQKEFDKFIKEARAILKAFKKLEIEE